MCLDGRHRTLKQARGQSDEQKRTTIDYYIKQNEIVSPLEGRKVINSEGPVIRKNDIISSVCFGLQFKRKNCQRIWYGERCWLIAWGTGICCFLVSFYFLFSGSRLTYPDTPFSHFSGDNVGRKLRWIQFLHISHWRLSVFKSIPILNLTLSLLLLFLGSPCRNSLVSRCRRWGEVSPRKKGVFITEK